MLMYTAILSACDLWRRQSGVFPVKPPGSYDSLTLPGLPGGPGGGNVTVNTPGQAAYPPWEVAPPGSQPFDYVGVISTPAAGSTDQLVLSFQVPFGWDGTIKKITNVYTGPGFFEGSGDLIWRIRRDGQFVKNYDSILVTFGDVQNGHCPSLGRRHSRQ
ncbi:MAG: hypothetical protein IPK75_20215 [Acidobacteria bacterium]|nr:hypothetical protein [Acidobacteriota bacterium]